METNVFVVELDSARNHVKDCGHVKKCTDFFAQELKEKLDCIRSKGWTIEAIVPFEMETNHNSFDKPLYAVTSYFVYCVKS